jgi:hypothetical protein
MTLCPSGWGTGERPVNLVTAGFALAPDCLVAQASRILSRYATVRPNGRTNGRTSVFCLLWPRAKVGSDQHFC